MNPKPCPNGSMNPRRSPKRFAKSRTSFVNPKTCLIGPIHSLKSFLNPRSLKHSNQGQG
jgi:hypothetical protein